MSKAEIKAEVEGDYVEVQDSSNFYALIPIDKWQDIKDAVDAKLHGKYHHLRELIKNTDPIKLD